MGIKANGWFTFDGTTNGLITVIGTDEFQFTDLLAEAPSGKCYVTGTILNTTPQAFQLKIVGIDSIVSSFTIPAYAGIRLVKLPMQQMRVAVNGTIRLIGLGFIVDPIEPNKDDGTTLLNVNSGLFIDPNAGLSKGVFAGSAHTDITTATTTTVVDPTTGFTARLYKITISTQASNRITLESTNSGGTNAKIIGILNFAGEGTFIYDFGDLGWSVPNGVNGLLKVITTQATVVDVDVIVAED